MLVVIGNIVLFTAVYVASFVLFWALFTWLFQTVGGVLA